MSLSSAVKVRAYCGARVVGQFFFLRSVTGSTFMNLNGSSGSFLIKMRFTFLRVSASSGEIFSTSATDFLKSSSRVNQTSSLKEN